MTTSPSETHPAIRRNRLILIALWFFFYSTVALFTPPLLDDADSVHAEVAREILLRHDWVTLYALAVNEEGKVLGSISGGCVEPAAISEAMNVIETGVPQRMTYGITDEDACAVGLTCGGTVHLMIERIDW